MYRHTPAFQGTRQKGRSEEHTSELQSRGHLVCRLLLEEKKVNHTINHNSTKNLIAYTILPLYTFPNTTDIRVCWFLRQIRWFEPTSNALNRVLGPIRSE